MNSSRLPACLCLALLLPGAAMAEPQPRSALRDIRTWSFADSTRVVIETTGEFTFTSDRVPNPDRLFFDLQNTAPAKPGLQTYPVNDSRVRQMRVAITQPGVVRVVFDLAAGNVEWTASRLTNPPRLVVELRAAAAAAAEPPAPAIISASPAAPKSEPPKASAEKPAAKPEPVLAEPGPALPKQSKVAAAPPGGVKPPSSKLPPPPKPASMSTQSMTRALGLKIGRIVLDAGHGGHDTGTAGPGGLLEKDLVLDVTKRLGALLESRMGAEVIYTRSDDTFIPLERRTEIANERHADLFLSIHANSSPAAASSGVETFYLNFTENKQSMELAARENAGSARTVGDLRDLLQKIALQDKLDESRQFAERVQDALYSASAKSNSRTRNRGVKKAPFIVLIGAAMPSVLAEIGFVSNPKDEALLRRGEFRQKLAEGLYSGIARYASTLSQFQFAQN